MLKTARKLRVVMPSGTLRKFVNLQKTGVSLHASFDWTSLLTLKNKIFAPVIFVCFLLLLQPHRENRVHHLLDVLRDSCSVITETGTLNVRFDPVICHR